MSEEEDYDQNLDLWVKDLQAMFEAIDEEEEPTPKSVADNQEKMLDLMAAMIVQIRIIKEYGKINARAITQLSGVGELSEMLKEEKEPPKKDNGVLYI